MGASFVLSKEPVWIMDSIVTTGETTMLTEYEQITPLVYALPEMFILYPVKLPFAGLI